jgi:cysteine desulfurase
LNVIYLDHAASSPLLPDVLEAMAPWLGRPGNPASIHRAGREAAAAVSRARAEVAALAGCDPDEVLFVSGATEANHTLIRAVPSLRPDRRRVVVGAVEHPSVPAAAAFVARDHGWAVDVWPAGRDGRVIPHALPDDTGALAIMAANNETGVIQPIAAAAAEAQRVGALLHVDATQAIGRAPLDLTVADAIAFTAHKLGGPVGTGALVFRGPTGVPALITGGSQERGRRAGTVNVVGAVGFGEACRLARVALAARIHHYEALSERLRAGLRALGGREVGAEAARTPSTTSVVLGGATGDVLVQALDLEGVCVSSGAACASGSVRPSPTLLAMGDPDPTGAIRFSFGPTTTEADVDAALAALGRVLPRVRAAFGR